MLKLRQFAWRLRARSSHFGRSCLAVGGVCVAVFVVQRVTAGLEFVRGLSFEDALSYTFGLHWPLLSSGFFWQPVTYMFLHGSWMHLALNLFSLLFFGSTVEFEVGRRRFWQLFLVSGIIGGLGWVAADWAEPLLIEKLCGLRGAGWAALARHLGGNQAAGRYGICVGASAGVFGLLGAFAALCPRRELVVLVLFFPVRMRARQVAILLVAVTLVEMGIGRGQVAYAAHLAGGLAGYWMALARLRRQARPGRGWPPFRGPAPEP